MNELLLARHGESETSARGIVGGDAPLTPRGQQQARALRARITAFAADVCLTSAARRALDTAVLAVAGRDLPIEVVSELGDISFGSFDGARLEEYRAWVVSHAPTDAPPRGESRVETLRRFTAAFRVVLAREEERVVVIAHGLTIRALLDERPRPVVAGAPYGGAVALSREELMHNVERLEFWCEGPAW